MVDFAPIPPKAHVVDEDNQPSIEEFLMQGLLLDGYLYFVQYNGYSNLSNNSYNFKQAKEIHTWLREQSIEFNWVGGRASYELCFKSVEDATMFKLAFG